MSVVWIAFWCGLFLGVPLGTVALALCVVAKRSDEDIERMFADAVPHVVAAAADPCGLKLFCANDHQWFGECLPAACPFCHGQSIGARL